MANRISLVNMVAGQTGRVVQIDGGYGMMCKLDALGIRVGKQVHKVSGQPMGGPVIISQGGTQVALGFGMARRIWVEIERPE